MGKIIDDGVSKDDLISMTEYLYKKGKITKEERDKIILIIIKEP